jgi:Transglutaminase-like superfamily
VNQVRRFWNLSTGERRLLFAAVVTLAACQLALRIFKFQRLQLWAGRVVTGSGAGSVEATTWAVHAAARRMPWVTCLARALALQRLLARRGHVSELRVGVAKAGQDFSAHAWLVRGDRVLIGDKDLGRYTALASWNARGGT